MARFLDWLRGGDRLAAPLPPALATAAGVVFVIYAGAQPLSPGLAAGAVAALVLLYLIGWVCGAVRLTPLAALVFAFFGAVLAAIAFSPDILWIVSERWHGAAPSPGGDPRWSAGPGRFRTALDYWHFLLLPAGILWAGAGWKWGRRAFLALGISTFITLASSGVELAFKINFRWDILGPAFKKLGLLWLIGRETVARPPESRVMGFFDHPLTYGGFLAVVSFTAAGLALYSAGSSVRGRRLFAGLLAGAGGLMLLLAKNRGYWLGALPAAALLLRHKGRRALIALAIAAGLAFTAGYTLSHDFRTRFDGMFITRHSNERFAFWRAGLDMVRDRPLTGWGVRGYRMHGQLYRDRHGAGLSQLTHVHNSYLQVAVEGGLLLESCFLALIAYLLHRLWRLCGASDHRAPLARGALAALGCFLVAALFEYNFGDKEPAMILFFILGAALHLPEEKTEGE